MQVQIPYAAPLFINPACYFSAIMPSLKARLAYELSLLSKLVAIDTSTPAKYWKFIRILGAAAGSLGLETRIISKNYDKPNLVIYLDSENGKGETLLIAAHYDTVPTGDYGWRNPPFQLTVLGRKAYGRGTCDNKGAIAAALGALKELKMGKSKVNVSLLVTCDEETDGELGLGAVLRKKQGTAGIVLDSDPKSVAIGACGVVWGKITIKGVQGHAAFPHKFRNAIDLPFIKELSDYSRIVARKKSRLRLHSGEKVWGRFSITMIHGGEKENVIPGECEIGFDFRTLPEENVKSAVGKFRKYFEKLRKKHDVDATMKITKTLGGYRFPSDSSFVKAFAKTVGTESGRRNVKTAAELFGNDGYFFRRHDIPSVCFGPLNVSAHGRDEFVLLSDIELVKRTLVRLCVSGWQ